MPNGYAFVIVLIIIALVGGLVCCLNKINDLQDQLEPLTREISAKGDELVTSHQETAACQADFQKTKKELADALALIAVMKTQSPVACGPEGTILSAASTGGIPSSETAARDVWNLGRILSILAAGLGAGGSGALFVRRIWRIPFQQRTTVSLQAAAVGPRSYYMKVTDDERSQLVKKRRNR